MGRHGIGGKNKNNNKRKIKTNAVYRTLRYQNSTRPSTYGPGYYNLNVTKLVSGALNTQVTINGYYDIIYQNPELSRVKSDFKYFKYRAIAVTFYPRNINSTGNETPCYFTVNYDGLPTENLRLQDNVKIVPAFHIKQRTYKFRIPNILSQNGALNAWITDNELNNLSQVLLQFHAQDNTTNWHFRIDVNIACRGPTNTTEVKELKTNELVKKNNLTTEQILKKREENRDQLIKKIARLNTALETVNKRIKDIKSTGEIEDGKEKDDLGNWDEYSEDEE